MENALVRTNAAPPAAHEQPKWLTLTETSALADRGTMLPFNARAAVSAFTPERLRELALRYDAALIPADGAKLAARLRALWESTTAPNNMTAKSWLHEGCRLLGDLPFGIAHRAIDQAVKASDRGFTPSVAAIRTAADPMMAELRRHAARLHAVIRASQEPEPATAADHPHAAGPHDRRSTSEILAETWPGMDRHETGQRAVSGGLDPDRPCRAPTREDYLRMGVSAETLDQLAPTAEEPQAQARAA